MGTGRVVYDNKANPVKAYEPFFDTSPAYDDETDLVNWGVTAITRYDPLSRVIRVDNPNGTFRTVEFDPWQTITSDENDTVLASSWYAARHAEQLGAAEADAAAKAAADAATPSVSDLDTLGRVFRTVADNGPGGQYPTRLGLDIRGQVRTTTDALGRADPDPGLQPGRRRDPPRQRRRGRALAGRRCRRPAAAKPGTAAARRAATATTCCAGRPACTSRQSGGAQRLAEQVTYGESLANAQALQPARRRLPASGRGRSRDHRPAGLQGQRPFRQPPAAPDYAGDVDWSQAPAVDAETFTTSHDL